MREEKQTVIHHVKSKDVERLKSMFAYFNPNDPTADECGWVIPEWMLLMERTVQRSFVQRLFTRSAHG